MSYVYFARCDQYVKIGFSYRPQRRLKGLLRGVIKPDDLSRYCRPHLIKTIPECVMKDERRLHERFGAHHAGGEFFLATPAFLTAVESLDYETVREERARMRRERAAAKADQHAHSP